MRVFERSNRKERATTQRRNTRLNGPRHRPAAAVNKRGKMSFPQKPQRWFNHLLFAVRIEVLIRQIAEIEVVLDFVRVGRERQRLKQQRRMSNCARARLAGGKITLTASL